MKNFIRIKKVNIFNFNKLSNSILLFCRLGSRKLSKDYTQIFLKQNIVGKCGIGKKIRYLFFKHFEFTVSVTFIRCLLKIPKIMNHTVRESAKFYPNIM